MCQDFNATIRTAVNLMMKGRDSEAVGRIAKALRRLPSSRSKGTNASSLSSQQGSEQQHRGPFISDAIILYTVELPDITLSEISYSPNSHFSTFNKAFVVLTYSGFSTDSLCETKESNKTKYLPPCDGLTTVVLMYNMGLAFHRLGLQNCTAAYLERAHILYNKALSWLMERDVSFDQQEHNDSDHLSVGVEESIMILMLAIINNMGQVNSTLSNHKLANDCRRRLTRHVGLLSESHPCPETHESYGNEDNYDNSTQPDNDENVDIEFFVRAALRFIHHQDSAPAA